MRFPVKAVLAGFLLPALCLATQSVIVVADEPGSWPKILNAVGIPLTQADNVPPADLAKQIEAGAIAVLMGDTEYSQHFGIQTTPRRVPVRSLIDARQPKLPIIWEKQLEVPVFQVPEGSTVFAKERWSGAPMLAGIRRGAGALLWLAVPPGEKGYERYPYIVQALTELGLELPLSSRRLWAFFDGAYRSRVDLDYLAERWRQTGIAALHVGAWHYMERDVERDRYVETLIAACHRQRIQVYAWLELPHVSEQFWRDNPGCREKTALLQDAHLDWRKLINLANPGCAAKVAAPVKGLLERFDWDGVNIAELYFESLE
ncbi:MAG TPA: hypothetical protein VEQ63_11050, partial [Bryobacteraceae bacterium]|nr:hypothetical protein [Bryobacteraceae bacterium]